MALDAILGKMDRRSGFDRLCDWVRADAEEADKPDPVQLLREDPCRVFEPLFPQGPDPWQRDVLTCGQLAVMLLCSRQSGKSQTMAACAINEAIVYPYAEVVVLSRTLRQSVELLRKVKELWRGLTGGKVNRRRPARLVSTKGELVELENKALTVGWEDALLMTDEFHHKTSNKALSMDFPNGSRITSLPCNPDGIVGFSAITLLILDEAARVSEAAFNVASPFLAATESQHGRPGRKIVASTPCGKRGWFWEGWDRTERQRGAHARGVGDAKAGLTRCPWSDKDVERRLEAQAWRDGHDGKPLVTQWYTVQVTADQCPRITKQFLEDEREQLGLRWYQQEYETKFVDLVDSVFSHEDVHSLADSSYSPAKAWFEE